MDKDYLIAQLRSLGDSEPVQLRNRKLREQVRSLVNSDTAKTMDKDYLIAQLRSLGDSELVQDRDRELEEQIRSLSNAEHVPDSKRELREQVQAAQTQEEDLCTKIAGLEIKLAESQDELAHYKQYTTELHSTLDKKNDKILDLDLDLGDARSELNELREQNRFLSEVQREAEENDSRLAAVAKDNRELKIALKLKNTCIDELRYESYQKEEELMALRHKLAASEDQVNKLQNQVITNPVDITLSYSAQASPNAGPPSAGSDSSGIGPNQHDAYIVTKDPFRAPTQDPHARMMELKAEIKLHLEDIKLYKLDVRGYKKDVKALKKGIQFRDDKIEELNQKIEEYKDAFIGLNNAYAWGTQAPPPPPPPRTSSPTTSQQGYHPSSPVGLGIDVLAPAPLRTRPKAPLQPSPGPWCPVISSNPQHETPLSKFNAAYDSSPTPPLITTMQGTYHGSPVTMSRKSQYPKSHTSKSHTPKMPIITEQ